MKTLTWLVLGAVPVALIVWRVARRFSTRDLFIESAIRPPRYTFTGHDDELRVAADRRKVEAEEMRRRAALYAAGQHKPADVRRFRREAR